VREENSLDSIGTRDSAFKKAEKISGKDNGKSPGPAVKGGVFEGVHVEISKQMEKRGTKA